MIKKFDEIGAENIHEREKMVLSGSDKPAVCTCGPLNAYCCKLQRYKSFFTGNFGCNTAKYYNKKFFVSRPEQPIFELFEGKII